MDNSIYEDWRETVVWKYLPPDEYPSVLSWQIAEEELAKVLSSLATMNLRQLETVKFSVDFRLRNF